MINSEKILSFIQELAAPAAVNFQCDPGMAPDAYRFNFADGVLQVTGENPRGALYAVYDFLDGKRSGGDAPRFRIRGVNPCEALARHTPDQLRKFIDRIGRWKFNTIIIHTQYGYQEHRALLDEECSKRGIDQVHYTYYNLAFCDGIPTEYFARKADGSIKVEGSRLECYDRLCASNPTGLELYRQGVNSYLRQHPELDNILFATSDGQNYCECPACQKLGSVEQCSPFFDPFFDAAEGRNRHFISYHQRYHLPQDTSRLEKVENIMFDTHVRDRQYPLRDSAGAATVCPKLVEVDSRAKQSVNRYLTERLKEWRQIASGNLYVFENYMMQSIYGVPVNNHQIYFDDLKLFAELGLDGVIYEAFEPGIPGMLPLLDAVALALWHPEQDFPVDDSRGVNRPDYQEFYRLVRAYKADRNWPNYLAMMTHILSRPDYEEFDWRYIGFNAAWFVQQNLGPYPRTGEPLLDRFLSINKLWDFMEEVESPRETTEKVIRSLLAELKKAGF